jgi:glycosyltransferase involved in cell wall biosynthesis
MKLCIITWPLNDSLSGKAFLSDIIKIFSVISEELLVITQLEGSIVGQEHPHIIFINVSQKFKKKSLGMKILDELFYYCNASISILKNRNNFEGVWFYGGATLFLPLICAKILNKRIYVNILGIESIRILKVYQGFFPLVLSFVLRTIEHVSYKLADKIIIESESMIPFGHLEPYSHKIIKNGARFIDTTQFNIFKRYDERDNMIGYVGRLSEEKGVLQFFDAISSFYSKNNGIENFSFLICGDGPLLDGMKEKSSSLKKENHIQFTGWIDHRDLPKILNSLKILVLPSFSEGLPTIILEAMACGTPVLATDVGGIPDIVKNGVNGFIITDNSPEAIRNGITAVSSYKGILSVILSARGLIEEEYSYDKSLKRFRAIIESK